MSQPPSVPGYRISKTLGIGGMATVYLATQVSLQREVALKVLLPQLATNGDYAERFLREGRIAASLQHPHLLTVYDIGGQGELYYMATEFLPDGSLKERIDKGPLRPEAAVKLLAQIAEGLGFLHSKGFVHRDIKPANILFRKNGSAVLADFGIAKAVNAVTVASVAGSAIGTPHYMSPEQARGEKLDGRSDLYSLGVVLYEMLTGTRPYSGKDALSVALMHVTDPIPVLHDRLGFYQPLIDGLMAKSVQKRFQTADELIENLVDFMPVSTTSARHAVGELPPIPEDEFSTKAIVPLKGPTPAPAAAPKPRERRSMLPPDERKPISNGILIAMIVALLAVMAGVIWWKLSRPTPAPISIAAPVDAAARAQIETQLQSAGQMLERGLLIEPPDANALAQYRAVLAREPNNSAARAGVEKVAQALLADINRRSVSGADALGFAQALLPLFPGDARFQDQVDLLKRPTTPAPTPTEGPTDPKMADLYARAKARVDAKEFIRPAGASASDYLNAMLREDPQQSDALALRAFIVDDYLKRIREYESMGNMDAVMLVLVDEALQVDRDNQELKALRGKLAGR
jgi:serine/threonine-protein kinase PpkA